MHSVVRTATSLASEAGRLSQMLTTQIVEKTKEVGVPAHLYETAEERTADILPGLNSKFDKEKLDALKRLVALMSKGRSVSEFFPHVIKNVASQSFDVRKLVYIYLLRYAEQEPDLALLSINTFQKDMTDKNPLIRAMALRVLSSIRVPVISSIIVLALRKGVVDLSPYVRKAAANAIQKCYSLDPSQRESLIDLLSLLLNDKSTVVLGTAVLSLNRICPDRYDLIHKHYHKLCRLLVDCDEWGQIEIISMLMRYTRVHFLPPTDTSLVSSTASSLAHPPNATTLSYCDSDHAEFITSLRPLLHSRNISVVLTVITAFLTTGCRRDLYMAIPALIRLVRYSRENQYAVLMVVLSVCRAIPTPFAEYCRWFVVFDGDVAVVRDLKLEILECIACESNVAFVLSEFKTYVLSSDEMMCVRTIQAWGRLASRLPQVIEESLSTLVALVSETNAMIAGEVIIVLRRLLQLRSDTGVENGLHKTKSTTSPGVPKALSSNSTTTLIVRQLFQTYGSISVAMAKASVLWLIGQNVASLARVAPDALRVALKTFGKEEVIVKLQTLNLAANVAVCLEVQAMAIAMEDVTSAPGSCDECGPRVLRIVRLCFEYVLELAKYDLDFDVRDRARFLDTLVHLPVYGTYASSAHNDARGLDGVSEVNTKLALTPVVLDQQGLKRRYWTLKRLMQILAGSQGISKPADPFSGLAAFRVGTLSHLVEARVEGYTDLPPWATVASDKSLRTVMETTEAWHRDRVVTSAVKHVRVSQVKKMKKRVVALDDFLSSGADQDDADMVASLRGLSVGRSSVQSDVVADTVPRGPPESASILEAASVLAGDLKGDLNHRGSGNHDVDDDEIDSSGSDSEVGTESESSLESDEESDDMSSDDDDDDDDDIATRPKLTV
ncbi:hypothetical protein BASA60_001312 [Batrachochytrium salamandrivorans]|nr:hypothetical protein BASA60_001312 [Batrachochytrium salamandrivorans]KAH9258783.1 hypothetical protein BASA81_002847 [Batrachochytrium salamandrivorans]